MAARSSVPTRLFLRSYVKATTLIIVSVGLAGLAVWFFDIPILRNLPPVTSSSTSMLQIAIGFLCALIFMPLILFYTNRMNRTETRFQESEELFLTAFESSPIGICFTSLDGTLQHVNRSLADMLGCTKEELEGKHFNHITHPDDIEIGAIALKKMTSGDISSISFEKRYLRNNGEAILVHVSSTLLRDSDGTPLHFITQILDITKLKQAEEQFHVVVESAPNAILLVGSDGKIRLVNAQVEHYFGYQRNEFIGMDIDQLIPDRFRQAHVRHRVNFQATPHARLLGTGRDLYGLRKDGSEFPVEVGLTPLESRGESLVMVTVVDITVRKQAEQQSQRQLKRLSALRMIDIAISSSFNREIILNVLLQQVISQLEVDASALLLFKTQLQEIEYVASRGIQSEILQNKPFRLVQGYARQIVLERKTTHISGLTQPGGKLDLPLQLQNESFVDYCGTPLIVKGVVKGILEVYHRSPLNPDAEWLDFLETLAGQAAVAIENTQLLANLERNNADLERRVWERTAELNRTNAQLEHANRAKDEFLANMSHELRTPLNSVLGLSESLLEQRSGPLTEQQQKSLRIIESSGHHLLELINEVLDLSRVEAGKLDFYPQVISVEDLCKSSLSLIRPQATKKSITITYTNEASIAKIYADARRLKQALVNLLTNAVKFTPDYGAVTLQVCTKLDQDLIQFSVIDTGIGIASEDLNRLFQPFAQVDSSLNRQYEGTGLGLALVQKLIDLHGGSVEVESEPGKGSRFTINLSCNQEEISNLDEEMSRTERCTSTLAEQNDISGTPMKRGIVLLVEDNMANILTVGDYLESLAYEVMVAHDGLEALTKTKEYKPDVILMDIQMPGMNGLEAIARLRADYRCACTPIIALTALAMPGDRERCLQIGANEYLCKPVSLKKLLEVIEKMTLSKN